MSNVSSKPPIYSTAFVALLSIVTIVVSYVLSAFIASNLTGLAYVLLKGTHYGLQDWLTTTTTAQFLYTIITYGLFLIIVVTIFKRFGIRWSDIRVGRPRLKDFFWALGFLPLYYSAYLIVIGITTLLLPGFNADQQQQIGFENAQGIGLLAVFISLVVIPPVVEEIITRGYLYTGLKRACRLIVAAVTTSLVFAVGHLEFGNGGPLVYVAAIFTFVLSIFLIILREKTGQLWASIFLHAMVNGLSFAALFVYGSR